MQSVPFYLAVRRRISSSKLLLIMVCISGCQTKRQDRQWDFAGIDPTIAENVVYRQLDKENEVFSVVEDRDTSMKRTSGVAYFTRGHVNLSDSNSARRNNCRAYYVHGDTLSICIGIGDGFGGWGFIIHYKNKKFNTEPFYSTDIIIPDKPVYEIVYQNLNLNKPVYKVGDSLYGKVDFKCFEVNDDKSKIEHSGKGYFRTKVKGL